MSRPLFALLGILLFLFAGGATGWSQSYGPPSIAINGGLFTYQGTWTDSWNNYGDIYSGPDTVTIDSSGNVWFDGQWGGSYSAGSYSFSNMSNWYMNSAVAVSADGNSFLGVPAGVVVRMAMNSNANLYDSWWHSPDYSYSNNGVSVAQFNVGEGDVFEINSWLGTSPWYQYSGNGDLFMDVTDGYPSSNLFNSPPSQMYIDGGVYNIGSTSSFGGSGWYQDETWYNDANGNTVGWLYRYYNWGYTSGSVGTSLGAGWNGSIDPNSLQITALPPGIAISFSQPPGSPAFGPPMISWNGSTLQFSYTDQWGSDIYVDSSGSYSATVNSAGWVTVSGGNYAGNYTQNTETFNFNNDPNMVNFFAQDWWGNPIGLPVGVTLLFGANGSGQAVMTSNGTAVTGAPYTFRRTDGSWGMKYAGLPDGPLLVQDSMRSYTSPVYCFTSATGDLLVNAINGWPPTNLFPPRVYVNGIACALSANTLMDSGGAPPGRIGSATYTAGAYSLSVRLGWAWNSQFQGAVSISYQGAAPLTGGWDGMAGFTNLPAGYTVTLAAPAGAPVTGPPSLSVNGVALTFNPGASGANNSQNADIYQSASGTQIVIYPNLTATLTRRDGSTVTGTYNPQTFQFNFGDKSVGIISALDNTGQALDTLVGGGQVTQIPGMLDVQGNSFTLGSWANGSAGSVNAFSLSYSDVQGSQPAMLGFSATRTMVNWLWSRPQTDGSSSQLPSMMLDTSNRLNLYSTANSTTPRIVLDPNGNSHLEPQGDISMGQFTQRPPGQ